MGGKVTKLVIFCGYHKSMTPCLFFSLHSVAKLCSVLKLEDFALEITWNFVEKNAVDTLSHEIKKIRKIWRLYGILVPSLPLKTKILSIPAKNYWKIEIEFFSWRTFWIFKNFSQLFYPWFCLTNFYASELFQAPSNLNHLISFATLRPFTRF